ncbi:MAG: hypothetical protein AAF415_00295 [Pseudomonadota bacterium]
MNMLMDTLGELSSSYIAWLGVGFLALMAAHSYYHWLSCPYLCQKHDISVDEAREAIDRPISAGPRFLLSMTLGIAATIAGLFLLHRAIEPGVAFMLIVAGLVVMQTEPIRLQLRDSVARLVAASTGPEETQAAALDSLRTSHLWLVSVHFIMLFAVIAALLVF